MPEQTMSQQQTNRAANHPHKEKHPEQTKHCNNNKTLDNLKLSSCFHSDKLSPGISQAKVRLMTLRIAETIPSSLFRVRPWGILQRKRSSDRRGEQGLLSSSHWFMLQTAREKRDTQQYTKHFRFYQRGFRLGTVIQHLQAYNSKHFKKQLTTNQCARTQTVTDKVPCLKGDTCTQPQQRHLRYPRASSVHQQMDAQ